MGQKILALEPAGEHVRAALGERTWNSLTLRGFFDSERAAGESDLGGALRRLVAEAGRPDVVISAIPSELVAKRLLELPFHDMRRLRQVVPFALEEHLPVSAEDSTVGFLRAGGTPEKSYVTAALVKNEHLRRHLELLATAGLDPKTVTASPYALAGLFSRNLGGPSRPHLLIDVETESSSLVLLDASGAARAIRTVSAGFNGSGADPREGRYLNTIVNAARQTLLAQGAEIESPDLIVTGAAAAAPEVAREAAKALSLPLSDAREFLNPGADHDLSTDAVRYATCVAMLASENPDRPIELLDFRQGPFAFRGSIRIDFTPFRTTAILAGALLGLIVLHFALGVSTRLYRLNRVNRQIAAVAAPVLGPDADGDVPRAVKSRIAALRRRLGMFGGGADANTPLDTLLTLSRAIPANVGVELRDVKIGTEGVKLSGYADEFKSVDQVKQALSRLAYFSDIRVTNATTGADGGKVEFNLDASFGGLSGDAG